MRRLLLAWYDRTKRDLPWRRRADDPYAQWVAEIMLQQTRVDTVEAYYEQFLRRFSDIGALAAADHQEVLKYWEGLGYYRRILHLHRAARLLDETDQAIPSTAEELQKLPGVGAYTAAAIASIAFGQQAAAVDGNVARVLARLFGITDDILSTRGKQRITRLATQLVPRRRPGDFNQAWMDLGSGVCTPRSPKCDDCPLVSLCVAARTKQTETLPRRGKDSPRKPVDVALAVGVLLQDDKMLVRRRPTGGLWSGLWEFPNSELSGRAVPSRTLRQLITQEGLAATERSRKVGVVEHKLTHRSLSFHTYVVAVRQSETYKRARNERRWVTVRGFERLSVSTAHRKVFQKVREEHVGLT